MILKVWLDRKCVEIFILEGGKYDNIAFEIIVLGKWNIDIIFFSKCLLCFEKIAEEQYI